MEKIAILGAGSWGTALAMHMGQRQKHILLYDQNAQQIEEINKEGTNQRYLPGIKLPEWIRASTDLEDVVKEAPYVFLVVPSQALRELIIKASPYLHHEPILINCAKGLDRRNTQLLSSMLKEELPATMHRHLATLSGPTHAEEISLGLPSAAVIASKDEATAKAIQELIMSPSFRIYTSHDEIGVELGGVVKNSIAIAAGISDGMGYGDNTKAALITRGLQEITRLGLALGAQASTFSGLAGLGDLVVTCTSRHSRNWNFGYRIGQGYSREEAVKEIGQVVEGVVTTELVYALAQSKGVEMPITRTVYEVLNKGLSPKTGVEDLMCREPKFEMEALNDVPVKE